MSFDLKHFAASCLALLIGLITMPAQALPYDAGHARVDLVSEYAVLPAGSTARVALTLDIDDHWHVYWKNPGDSGLPAQILWDEATDVQMSDFQWPLPHPQPIETLMNYGYENRLVLPFDVEIPEDAVGAVELRGSAEYLICKDICIPEQAPVQLVISIGDTPVKGMAGDAFDWADAHKPMPLSGAAVIDRSKAPEWQLSIRDAAVRAAFEGEITNVRFFPEDHQINHPPEQPVSIGEEGVTLTLEEAEGLGTDGTLSGVLVLEDIGGNRIGFSLTSEPGEKLDGTSGKVFKASTGSAGAASGGDMLSIPALIGILGAALLGGAVLNLMPCVLPVLFIKARSFLSLAGHDDHNKIRQHGVFYLLGVVTCFLGFGVMLAMLRAAGEQVGLGFQLQIPAVVAGLALLMYVLGLNMMGMFDMGSSLMGVGSGLADKGGNQGAFFTGVLAAFVGAPCIGPFIAGATGVVVTQPLPVILLTFLFIGLGMALPFALLSFFPHMFSALPKPGAWMERLKQFFAFPLFLTAIWLIWVLGQQADINAVAATAIGAVMITFGIWLFTAAPKEGSARQIVVVLGAAALVAGFLLPIGHMTFGAKPESKAALLAEAEAGYEAAWSPEKVDTLVAEGRPVFVDFTASWCVTCQVNKRTTLKTKRVQGLFEEHDVAFLVADWTRRDKIIGEELAKHGRAGVPLYLFYPGDGAGVVILPQVLTPDLVEKRLSEHL